MCAPSVAGDDLVAARIRMLENDGLLRMVPRGVVFGAADEPAAGGSPPLGDSGACGSPRSLATAIKRPRLGRSPAAARVGVGLVQFMTPAQAAAELEADAATVAAAAGLEIEEALLLLSDAQHRWRVPAAVDDALAQGGGGGGGDLTQLSTDTTANAKIIAQLSLDDPFVVPPPDWAAAEWTTAEIESYFEEFEFEGQLKLPSRKASRVVFGPGPGPGHSDWCGLSVCGICPESGVGAEQVSLRCGCSFHRQCLAEFCEASHLEQRSCVGAGCPRMDPLTGDLLCGQPLAWLGLLEGGLFGPVAAEPAARYRAAYMAELSDKRATESPCHAICPTGEL